MRRTIETAGAIVESVIVAVAAGMFITAAVIAVAAGIVVAVAAAPFVWAWCRWRGHRTEQLVGNAVRPVIGPGGELDQALALVCDPCNDIPGRCTCGSKCAHPLCGAEDTGITAWSPAEMAFLAGKRKELPHG